VNIEAADKIRDQIREQRRQIRVQCPRGHFIADVEIYVDRQGSMWMTQLSAFSRGVWAQEVADTDDPEITDKVRATCASLKCRYEGSFDYERTAIELAVYALGGHSKYRLTR
jgi:hypothetical protein